MLTDRVRGNSTLSSIAPLNDHVRAFTYDVVGTNVAVDFIQNLDEPIERDVLGLVILNAKAWLRRRLKNEGDDWLPPENDPFASVVADLCHIRIDSVRSDTGRSRMTYTTLLSVMEALWNVMYLTRAESEAVIKIHVAGILAGHGAVTVKEQKPRAVGTS